MRPLSYLIFIAIFFPLSMIAQSDLSQEEVDELQDLKKELEGTYQIQTLGDRRKVSIPLSLYGTIDSVRKEQEVVYHRVNDHLRVKVLPEERIEDPGFQAIEEERVHIQKPEKK